jgi:hypothetical protein
VSNAPHTVKVVAYDAAGNSGSKQQTVSVNNTTTTPPPTVTPDTTSPVAKITSPITGSRLKGGATKFTVSGRDSVGVVRIEVFGDGDLRGSSCGS